jgi:hypothetical protein
VIAGKAAGTEDEGRVPDLNRPLAVAKPAGLSGSEPLLGLGCRS